MSKRRWTRTFATRKRLEDYSYGVLLGKRRRSSGALAFAIRHTRHAWPGGYELFAVTDCGDILCPRCLCDDDVYRLCVESSGDDGWSVQAFDHTGNYSGREFGEEITCDHCQRSLTND